MLNQTLIKILRAREDISDYVFHFTKKRNAFETLELILEKECIRDVNHKGHICFSESPLPLLPSMFKLFQKYEDPIYAPYGIGIKKNQFWQIGGRPVIYGDIKEGEILPDEIKWRFQLLNPNTYDFSWLREWRIQTSEINLNKLDCFVIVDTVKDTESLYNSIFDLDDIDIDAQPEDGTCHTEYLGYFVRKFKIISIEEIEGIKRMSKADLEKFLRNQSNEDVRHLS